MVQWLRIRLPGQVTWVWSLFWESRSRNEACMPQLDYTPRLERSCIPQIKDPEAGKSLSLYIDTHTHKDPEADKYLSLSTHTHTHTHTHTYLFIVKYDRALPINPSASSHWTDILLGGTRSWHGVLVMASLALNPLTWFCSRHIGTVGTQEKW